MGQIKVAMKKRLDMIEQLLGAVRGYVKHEREIFENIAKLRQGIDTAEPGKTESDKTGSTVSTVKLRVIEIFVFTALSEQLTLQL